MAGVANAGGVITASAGEDIANAGRAAEIIASSIEAWMVGVGAGIVALGRRVGSANAEPVPGFAGAQQAAGKLSESGRCVHPHLFPLPSWARSAILSR